MKNKKRVKELIENLVDIDKQIAEMDSVRKNIRAELTALLAEQSVSELECEELGKRVLVMNRKSYRWDQERIKKDFGIDFLLEISKIEDRKIKGKMKSMPELIRYGFESIGNPYLMIRELKKEAE